MTLSAALHRIARARQAAARDLGRSHRLNAGYYRIAPANQENRRENDAKRFP
jgi:hypothetical protein